MAQRFSIPKAVWIGKNALKEAAKDICSLGRNALIVCGKSMIRQGYMDTLTDILDANEVAWHIYSDVSGEPTVQIVEQGTMMYLNSNCDFLIGFGGGSPLDAAKAIALLATCGGNLSSCTGKDIEMPLPPIAAIPTTAGTGSEVTQFTIITDTKTNVKMLIKGSSLIPDVAVVDPIFTVQTSKEVTVSAGLDALTHAVEAYTSRKAYDQSDRYALSAVERIFRYLPLTLQDMTNLEYREQMSVAAFEAGVSFNNSSVTLVHGMSRPLGAMFRIPHGLSNAMLLNVCLEYALPGACDRFANLAYTIKKAGKSSPAREAALEFLCAVKELCATCEVPTITQYGIDGTAFVSAVKEMSKAAIQSGSPSNTRRNIDESDIADLYVRLLN